MVHTHQHCSHTSAVSLLYCEVTTLTLHFFASNATYLERSVRSHLDLLVQRPTDFFLLKSCCACLKAISRLPLGTKLLSVSQFEAILPNLAPNLSSSASNLRAVTLDVLQVFGQALSSQVQRLLQLCELIQVTPTNNLQSGTQIPIWINELAEIVQVNALPRPILLLISNFLLGLKQCPALQLTHFRNILHQVQSCVAQHHASITCSSYQRC